MKKVITTVGTSIFENYMETEQKNDIKHHYTLLKDKPESEWEHFNDRIKRLRAILTEWSKNDENASAEIKSILKIKATLKEDIEVYLLATDTIVSRLAGEIINAYFSSHEEIKIKCYGPYVIKGLQVSNYDILIKNGLPNLIQKINEIAQFKEGYPGYWNDIIFNITGGYKAIIPYMTAMAFINRCNIAYIFEDMDSLILIPQLPIKIDMNVFKDYISEIKELCNGIENYEERKGKNYHKFNKLENMGLIEKADDLAILSPIGMIFYEHYKGSAFEFYAPDDVYSETEKQDDILRILKTKFHNKDIRDNKTETKGDHLVYDDGNNNNRIYYFMDNGNCYIYKTFQSEEKAKKFIETSFDRNEIIKKSKLRILEVQSV